MTRQPLESKCVSSFPRPTTCVCRMLAYGRRAMEQGVLQFDDLELDPERYELRRSGRVIKLERQPMELLILLAQRPGQLVTREDIIARLWSQGTFMDTNQSINSSVRKIRAALKDDAEQPRYLLTVVGKGYRFVAPLKVGLTIDPVSASVADPVTAPETGHGLPDNK